MNSHYRPRVGVEPLDSGFPTRTFKGKACSKMRAAKDYAHRITAKLEKPWETNCFEGLRDPKELQ